VKKPITFVKATAVGGLVLIVPLAVIAVALGYLVSILVKVNNFVAQYFPGEFLGHPLFVVFLAIALIVAICFLAGLLLLTGFGTRLAAGLDTFLVDKMPMYGLIKSATRRFTGDEILALSPAEVDLFGSEARMMGFVIEKLPDERVAVYVPTSPALTVGNVYIVPATSITLLDISAKRMIDAVTQWGSDTSLMYATETDKEAQPL
jgi:uncharacterized membrane protein